MTDFVEFQKIPRLSRDIVITEKIDGTNACVAIEVLPEGADTIDGASIALAGNLILRAGSRTRWITPSGDNHGFARWVEDNCDELMRLGEGRHYGEWWGLGIQRSYSQPRKRFSLFNTARWNDDSTRPTCCDVVPVLYEGPLEEHGVLKGVKQAMKQLQEQGSAAAPGFMRPEGIVIYHKQGNLLFKKTLEKDDEWKGTGA